MFKNLTKLQKFLIVIIVSLSLYIGVTYLSYNVFANLGNSDGLLPSPQSNQTPKASSTIMVSCPLNGQKYALSVKDEWNKRRPLGVMIENSTEARPQSGLSSADIVYEALAEGGITRFMGIFYCNPDETLVGPVRSARTYFLDWISEYDGLYTHVGGANTPGKANALGQIIDYKIRDLNQFSIGYPTFWRDPNRLGRPVGTEHTMYSTTDKLWEVANKRGWGYQDSTGTSWDTNFEVWKFKDVSKQNTQASQVSNIEVDFGQARNEYTVYWTYDSLSNSYKRKNGSENHVDLNNNNQLSPVNVVIQFEDESRANDGYPGNQHLIYGTIGKGRALIFQEGKVIEGQWIKNDRLSHTKYVDQNGQEVSFVRGQTWIETVATGSKVIY